VSDAIVLAGHGSRSPEANASLEALAATLAENVGMPVYPGFLEMTEPSIPAALRAAKAAGAKRIVLVPYFLLPGMHVKRDLAAIAAAASAELGLPVEIADFLGAHPGVPNLLADISRTALAASTT
jgi:sirohydrochlorin cobaltochelatase